MLKKAVMYVRVSSKEQNEQGFSPEAQRLLLYDFARRNELDVAKEFEDIETAKSTGRKEFQAMIEYVKERGIQDILVEKTDRMYRNFSDYVTVGELIQGLDATVHFVKEGSSIGKQSRASDKLMHDIRVVLAKNFIDNLREEVQKGYDIKIAHGEYPHQAPIGYLNVKDPYNPKHNIIGVDPWNSLIVVKMFEYYAAGVYSLQSLIAKLEADGLTPRPPAKQKKLHTSTVAKCLSNPFYIGKFMWKGKIIQTATHEPIISAELWQKVQAVLRTRNTNKCKEHNVQPFMYRGMFVCGVCSRSVTAEKAKGRYVYYHCTQYRTNCGQAWVKEETITKRFGQKADILKISDAGLAYVTAALKQSLSEKREWQDKAFDGLITEQTRLKKRMDALYEDRLDRKITEAFYDQKFTEYAKQLQDAEEKIGRHNRADVNYYEFGRKILELAENAELLLKNATPTEHREFMQYLLSNSKIKDGEPIFSLKQPFYAIEKRSPCKDRSSWQGIVEDVITVLQNHIGYVYIPELTAA